MTSRMILALAVILSAAATQAAADPPLKFYKTRAEALANEGQPPAECLGPGARNGCIATLIPITEEGAELPSYWVAAGWRKPDQMMCADASGSYRVVCSAPGAIPVPRFTRAVVCPRPPSMPGQTPPEVVCPMQEVSLPTREEFEADAKDRAAGQTKEP